MAALRVAGAALVIACCAGAAGAAGELDGRAFVGPTGQRGGPAERADERVEFAAGRFRSSWCEENGFPAAPYATKREGDAVRFESVLVSGKDGEIRWQGIVGGDAIEATYTWTKQGLLWSTRREYWFKGAPAGR